MFGKMAPAIRVTEDRHIFRKRHLGSDVLKRIPGEKKAYMSHRCREQLWNLAFLEQRNERNLET